MRLVVSVAIGMAAIWFGLVQNDWLDNRPAQRILFLGHSYTYYNDMPAMIGEMADSAGSDVRYDITMRAFPNASLEDHWNDRRSRSLLARDDWDRILIQPESYRRILDADHDQFRYAAKLLEGRRAAQAAVVVSWTASEGRYNEGQVTRAEHFQNVQVNYRGMASLTGSAVIDVARVWEDLIAQDFPFSLYNEDGNHPSVQGSYLAALVIYAELARSGVDAVTYVPSGMSGDDAALLRGRVQESLQRWRMAGFGSETQTAAAN